MGSGVSGRVSPPGTHVLLILGVERVHHIRRGLGIVAALLEALHRVRLGLLHGHLPSRLCTAVVDDGGAARVSPARVGAVRRGCARVSPLGRDAGLLLELRTVVDCFRSGRWGRAGVRSGRRVRRAWGEKKTLDACNTTPGRLRGRSARVEERRDRNWVPETIGASSTWPKDHARIGIASVEASQSRARAPPSRRVGRRNHTNLALSGDCTHPLASVDSPWRTARDLYCGRSRRANTAEGLYPSASATSRPAPSPMAPTTGSSGRYLRWKSFGVALESTHVEFPDEKV